VPEINTEVAHSSRVWNYLLGGDYNYPADRAVGDRLLAQFPSFVGVARQQRRLLGRMVRYLVEEAGIRQFLDIGSGLPTTDNTHQIAQRVAPEVRVVYVDNDPLVLTHACVLLTGPGTDYVESDVREPEAILAAAGQTLDLTLPVGLTMFSIMGQLSDEDEPHDIVRRLMGALAPGSYLALSDGTVGNKELEQAVATFNANSLNTYHLRPRERIAAFFDGLELVPPGVVPSPRWPAEPGELTTVEAYGGLARKRR
jgi:hypothetical protein